MINILKNISTLHNICNLYEYVIYLGLQPQTSIETFLKSTIICSGPIEMKKYPYQQPWNFFYQKIIEQQKKNEPSTFSYDNYKNQKHIVLSRKLMISDDMEQLYSLIGILNMDFLISNFKIFVKQDNTETYIQIVGEPLMTVQKKQFGGSKLLRIGREKILYCNHMSRQVGFFKKNFLSIAKREIQDFTQNKNVELKLIAIKATSNLIDQLKKKSNYTTNELSKIRPQLEQLMMKLQKIKYHRLFKYIAPLPQNYNTLRTKVKEQNCAFDDLYKCYTEYDNVISLLKQLTIEFMPIDLLGLENRLKFISVLDQFVRMKRFEDQTYMDYIVQINVFNIPWMDTYYNSKQHNALITKKRKKLQPLIEFLIQAVYIPFIRHNFYVTERHKDDWKLYYYRKELWHLIIKMSLRQLTDDNYTKIKKCQIATQYIGKLRLMPKPGTFRPLTTYQRKSKVTRKSLTQKLMDTKLVLRNLKSQSLGCSVFDNSQVFKRLEELNKVWKDKGCPIMYFLNLDISKCYDSIQLDKLLEFLENSKCFSFCYAINKYMILRKNKRPLSAQSQVKYMFNAMERVCAIPLDDIEQISKGYMENLPDDAPTIIINHQVTNIISFIEIIQNIKEVCQNNIVQFEKSYYRQRVGIPQGLNISGVLCSFYLSCIETQFTNRMTELSLTMRLTDDYCCLSSDRKCLYQLQQGFQEMGKCHNLTFSKLKTKSNVDNPEAQCIWIGKLIDTKLFQITPAFAQDIELNSAKFLQQVNVNIPRYNKLTYLQNKLKSLILNQLKYFFNPIINSQATQLKILKSFIKVGMIKFTPFLMDAMKFPRIRGKIIIKIINRTINELASYCCQISYNKGYPISQEYLLRFIRRHFRKSIKSSQFLRRIINIKYII